MIADIGYESVELDKTGYFWHPVSGAVISCELLGRGRVGLTEEITVFWKEILVKKV